MGGEGGAGGGVGREEGVGWNYRQALEVLVQALAILLCSETSDHRRHNHAKRNFDLLPFYFILFCFFVDNVGRTSTSRCQDNNFIY